MSNKTIKPNKVNVRKAGAAISNVQRQSETSQEEREKMIKDMLNGQKFVDEWNTEYVGKKGSDGKDLISHFKNIQLNSGLVIQMYMENPLKKLVTNDEGKVVGIEYGVQQIDYRKRQADTATWGPTPFPLVDKGVIMAISPAVKTWYYEEKEKLAKYDPAAAEEFVIPEVGDIVYTNHFLFKEHRYYVDKQAKCKDFVKSQEELRLNEFDFLFKITNYEIESIVKKGKEVDMIDYIQKS